MLANDDAVTSRMADKDTVMKTRTPPDEGILWTGRSAGNGLGIIASIAPVMLSE